VDLIDTIGSVYLRPLRELACSARACGNSPGCPEINVVGCAGHNATGLIIDGPAIAVDVNPKDDIQLLIGISRPKRISYNRLAVLIEAESLPLHTVSSNVRV